MPLSALLVPFLKLSNNEIAEALVKTMARLDADEGSWSAGLRVVQRFLATHGVDPLNVQLADGSGLSTANLATPEDLTTVLEAVQDEPWFQVWYTSLPIAAEPGHLDGGTLATRMMDTAAAGNVHAKTGTLTTSSSLTGYVTTASGELLVFSLMQSGFIGQPPRDVEDAFAVTLAEWSYGSVP